jgi:hypothetical protein
MWYLLPVAQSIFHDTSITFKIINFWTGLQDKQDDGVEAK